MSPTILIIDDDPEFAADLEALLSPEFNCRHTLTGEDGLAMIAAAPPNAVVLDLMLQGGRNGLEILEDIRKAWPSLPVIMATNFPTAESEAEALRRGALYYVRKAAGRAEVVAKLQKCMEVACTARECDRLREEVAAGGIHGLFIFSSPAMRELNEQLDRIAAAPNTTALLTGESGTGKSLLAREIHRRSPRAKGPFLAINMSQFSGEDIARSELFGHTKGAFTGAQRDKDGFFTSAKGGTLLLDEVADLSIRVQGQLLHAIEEREIFPMGETKTAQAVDVRVLAATNRNLEEMVKKESFREDLLGRLSVITIHVPPLREHPDDIPHLAREFMQRFAAEMPLSGVTITPKALDRLQHYSWRRYNVRELRNAIERALVHRGQDGILGPDAFDLPEDDPPVSFDYNAEKDRITQAFQRRFFERAFKTVGSSLVHRRPEDTKRVADLTGIAPITVRRVLEEIGA